jgi:hypothetical protein
VRSGHIFVKQLENEPNRVRQFPKDRDWTANISQSTKAIGTPSLQTRFHGCHVTVANDPIVAG